MMAAAPDPAIEGNPDSDTCRWCGNPKRLTGSFWVCDDCDHTIQPGTQRRVGPGL